MSRYNLLMLNLNTGEVRQCEGPPTAVSLHTYFNSINALNKSADVYGVVYLADEVALLELKQITEGWKAE